MKQDEKNEVHPLQIRIPQTLYEKLKYAARENHRTINAEVCMHLAQADLPSVTGPDGIFTAYDIRHYEKSFESLQGLIGQYEDRIEGMVSKMARAQLDLLNQAAVASRLQRLLAGNRKLPDSLSKHSPLQHQKTTIYSGDVNVPWKNELYSFEKLLEMRDEQQRETERDLADITKTRLAAEKCWREVKEMMAKLQASPPGSGEGE